MLGISTRTIVASALVLVLSAVAPRVRAQDPQRQAALVLRVLNYDRNIARRSAGRVSILVLYRTGHAASEAEQRALLGALNQLVSRMHVSGMRARAIAIPYTNRASLEQTLRSQHAAAIYVSAGLEDSVSDIMTATRAGQALSMTKSDASVRRGLSIGFVQHGSRVDLLINMCAAQAEGARLHADVLQLAQVLRSGC
jgi:hypothetical protein